MSYALLARMEDVDQSNPLDVDECFELAQWMVRTGFVHSAGRYGRWVEDVLDDMGNQYR